MYDTQIVQWLIMHSVYSARQGKTNFANFSFNFHSNLTNIWAISPWTISIRPTNFFIKLIRLTHIRLKLRFTFWSCSIIYFYVAVLNISSIITSCKPIPIASAEEREILPCYFKFRKFYRDQKINRRYSRERSIVRHIFFNKSYVSQWFLFLSAINIVLSIGRLIFLLFNFFY
jgi:hypothetical protein